MTAPPATECERKWIWLIKNHIQLLSSWVNKRTKESEVSYRDINSRLYLIECAGMQVTKTNILLCILSVQIISWQLTEH